MHAPLFLVSFIHLLCSLNCLASDGIWVQILGSIDQRFLSMVDHHFISEATHTHGHACVCSGASVLSVCISGPYSTRVLCPQGFSRQEHWSGLPCPPPGVLPGSGIKPTSLMSPSLASGFFTTSATWEAHTHGQPGAVPGDLASVELGWDLGGCAEKQYLPRQFKWADSLARSLCFTGKHWTWVLVLEPGPAIPY